MRKRSKPKRASKRAPKRRKASRTRRRRNPIYHYKRRRSSKDPWKREEVHAKDWDSAVGIMMARHPDEHLDLEEIQDVDVYGVRIPGSRRKMKRVVRRTRRTRPLRRNTRARRQRNPIQRSFRSRAINSKYVGVCPVCGVKAPKAGKLVKVGSQTGRLCRPCEREFWRSYGLFMPDWDWKRLKHKRPRPRSRRRRA